MCKIKNFQKSPVLYIKPWFKENNMFHQNMCGTPADMALMFPLPLHWDIVMHSDSQDTGSEFYKYKTFIDFKKKD